jgi:hypothetical protein
LNDQREAVPRRGSLGAGHNSNPNKMWNDYRNADKLATRRASSEHYATTQHRWWYMRF